MLSLDNRYFYFKRRSFLAAPFLLLLLGATELYALEPAAHEVVRTAQMQLLSEDPYWLTLLHYKKTLFSHKSTIDDPDFFLSETGHKHPAAELEATLTAFSEGDPNDPAHPINRFPARLNWLQTQLPKRITSQFVATESAFFEAIWAAISPTAASVIFPAEYMNSPASLFGHTLINIEGRENEKLLAYSINYSAVTTETNGVVFAIKGIFGQYEGRFSIDPYYKKVQEYSDLSMRDIWEYPLNLSREEVRNLMLHLWELQNTYSNYFFFNENCSFNLLFLLDAARPGSQLVRKFNHWVIPIDTIKAVRKNDFIADEKYRPSRSTKIKRIASTLPKKIQKDSITAVNRETEADSEPPLKAFANSIEDRKTKIRALDLSTELLKMKNEDGDLDRETFAQRYLIVLEERAKLGKVGDEFYPDTVPSPPHKGHDSGRVALGFGHYDNETVYSLALRPAYHSLMDPTTGYTFGSAIEFMSGELYYYEEEQKLEIRQLDFISIQSLSPIDTFFKSPSWKMNTGLTTIREEDRDERHTAFYFNSGIGLSFAPCEGTILYTFLEPSLYVEDSLQSKYMLGTGGSVGLLHRWNENWRSKIEARQGHYFLGQDGNLSQFAANIAYTFNDFTAFELRFMQSREFDQTWSEFNVRTQFFF